VSGSRLRIWLERGELEGGRGYWLRDAATGDALRWDDARLASAGAHVLPVAGTSHRDDALQDDAFAPGASLALVAEPENEHDPNAIGVWDAERRVQAGYVPAETAKALDADEWQAVSLLEFLEDGKRIGLRILLAPKDAWIGAPRR
jgi:hypothetical protein